MGKQRQPISSDIRRHVFIRDGFRCRYCDRWQFPWTQPAPEIDHITPVAKGGASRMSNYALACRDCNRRKGNSIWKPRPLSPLAYVIILVLALAKLVKEVERYG